MIPEIEPAVEYYKLASKDLKKIRERIYEMTKSQNTKNEQQKDLCITDDTLTEQWKRGELPSGWYWVDYYSVDGAVMLEYIPQHNGFGYEEKELVQAVLAEVPDYVEWQASEKYNRPLEEVKE